MVTKTDDMGFGIDTGCLRAKLRTCKLAFSSAVRTVVCMSRLFLLDVITTFVFGAEVFNHSVTTSQSLEIPHNLLVTFP